MDTYKFKGWDYTEVLRALGMSERAIEWLDDLETQLPYWLGEARQKRMVAGFLSRKVMELGAARVAEVIVCYYKAFRLDGQGRRCTEVLRSFIIDHALIAWHKHYPNEKKRAGFDEALCVPLSEIIYGFQDHYRVMWT